MRVILIDSLADLVPVLGKWGKGDEKGVGHQAIDSYYGDLMSQADSGLVNTWQQRVCMSLRIELPATKRSSRESRSTKGIGRAGYKRCGTGPLLISGPATEG